MKKPSFRLKNNSPLTEMDFIVSLLAWQLIIELLLKIDKEHLLQFYFLWDNTLIKS